ncbi:hypothetical protein AVEN_233779-1 [Araneus ventricosus]|uniref:Uncharacterized protein n=1 Tax=Araneus ventricosus TaxID=182803 RepID=A0A4Y2IBZ7_ARAVE|nr:hypothetical protein AVEN_233779-1 [Araneus ventricosus]
MPAKNALVKQLKSKKRKKAKKEKAKLSKQTLPATDSEDDADEPDYFPAPADRNTKNEIFTHNMYDTSSICINDYVLIKEGELKHEEIYSVGEIKNLNEVKCEVLYIKRLQPSFKFVLKLPHPIPSGATERKAEMLIFELT